MTDPAQLPDAEKRPEEPEDWRTFANVATISMLAVISFQLVTAALPLYLKRLGASQSAVGFEIGLTQISALVVPFLLGPAINRYGPRTFFRYGTLIYGLSYLGMALLASQWMVTTFRTVQGAAWAAVMPSASTFTARLVRRKRGTALGMLGAANNVGLAIGPAAGLLLYERGTWWLFAPAAAVAALALVATLFMPSGRAEGGRAPGFGFRLSWLPTFVANGLAAVYFGGIMAYLPLHLQAVHGPNAGIFFTADAIGVLLLRIPTGMLVDRRGALLPKLLGCALTLPGIVVLADSPSVLVLVVSGVFTGVGAGLLITGVSVHIATVSNEANRGTAMSLTSASFSAGIFLGSAGSGLLDTPFGWNGVVLFGFLTCLMALPLLLPRPRSLPLPGAAAA